MGGAAIAGTYMALRAVIILQTGLFAPNKRGLYDLESWIKSDYPDSADVWTTCRPFDANLDDVRNRIIGESPTFIVAIGHSFGAWHGTKKIGAIAAAIDRHIDLAGIIDGVQDRPFGFVRNCILTDRTPLPLPDNIESVMVARTVHHGFDPSGRRVEHPKIIGSIEFGPHDGVYHANIDEDHRVQSLAMACIQQVIGT